MLVYTYKIFGTKNESSKTRLGCCNSLQHTATYCNTLQHPNGLQQHTYKSFGAENGAEKGLGFVGDVGLPVCLFIGGDGHECYVDEYNQGHENVKQFRVDESVPGVCV